MSATRRALLAAALACADPGTGSAAGAEPRLSAAALSRGRRFGCAARPAQLAAESDLRTAVARECDVLTPEVELKWAVVEPERGRLDFRSADALAAFASSAGKRMRGHTLIWHRSVPAWAQVALASERDWGLVARYFASVMPRYGGLIDQWDVVNEPMDPGARTDALRTSPWLEAFGPSYIARALEEARRCAPHAQLFINEYGLEYDDADSRARRLGLLKLLERLKAQGATLDGLGLQSHLDLRKGRVSTAAIRSFCRDVAGLGLALAVTELDVKETDYIAPAPERDRQVADEARRYLETVLDTPGVGLVATWGLSDRHSWLQVEPSDYARFPGAWTHGDGPGLNRGLPLDASMRPKPMYAALHDVLASAPAQKLR